MVVVPSNPPPTWEEAKANPSAPVPAISPVLVEYVTSTAESPEPPTHINNPEAAPVPANSPVCIL